MTKLTELEEKFIQRFREEGEAACGVNAPDEMMEQNLSIMFAVDFQEEFGMSKQAVGGVLSSLLQKDLIYGDDTDTDRFERGNKYRNQMEFLLTDAGILAAYAE